MGLTVTMVTLLSGTQEERSLNCPVVTSANCNDGLLESKDTPHPTPICFSRT